MACWQAEVDFPDRGRMSWGVTAPDRETAECSARLVLEVTGYADLMEHVQVTGIPPPSERLRTGSGTFRSGSG